MTSVGAIDWMTKIINTSNKLMILSSKCYNLVSVSSVLFLEYVLTISS